MIVLIALVIWLASFAVAGLVGSADGRKADGLWLRGLLGVLGLLILLAGMGLDRIGPRPAALTEA
jgi:hypothetical protein